MVAEASEITGHDDDVRDHCSTAWQASIYSVEQLPNGLMRVFSRASKLVACFNSDGTYRHGDLGILRSVSEAGSSDYLTLEETLCWLDEHHRNDAHRDE
ncbi:MAG: hypothetical protein H0W76_26955 [Pyrinomonadaceae bacterium]|nr:hypothetical protein [Pyrinomonadaceae bacterium]